jgi:serine-type D-Ala-D-Ala carboxypeptidase/endopeptidase (penicillin-binding protein 4)
MLLRPFACALLLCLDFHLSAVGQRTAAASRTAPLPKTIAAILADPAVARAHWGISVVSADGKPIYTLNDGQSFAPASNAKLFTTATAFAVFSPESRFTTNVVARGTVTADGVVHGDLVIEGSGDPSLSGRSWPYSGHTERPNSPLGVLDGLAAQIALRGIHSVTGKVVGDDTAFTFDRYGSGWAWDDLQWEYGAPVSALSVNDNTIYLDILPGATAGAPVIATWNPAIEYYTLENTAVTGLAAPKPQLGLDRDPGSKVVRLYGTLPVTSKGVHLALAIEDSAEFTALAFRQTLVDRGITVAGGSAAEHHLSTETGEFLDLSRMPLPVQLPRHVPLAPHLLAVGDQVVASSTSPPLDQDLTVINKVSQNLHVELLLRDLGKAVLNDGSVIAGARVVRQFLISAGVDPGDFVFFDGSGLSPNDLITPRAATTLLAYAARQSWGEAFRNTLPIAGVDGTLSGRFMKSPVKGKLFAKTGTLAEVNALSGYLTASSGKTVIVSILCNDHDPSSEATRRAADRMIEAIYAAE